MFNFKLNLIPATQAVFTTVTTSAVAANRVATIVDKTLQLAENRLDRELADQKAVLAATEGSRDQRVAKKVAQHDEQWELN